MWKKCRLTAVTARWYAGILEHKKLCKFDATVSNLFETYNYEIHVLD